MKKLVGFLVAFILLSNLALSQSSEICNNGIDDDGDGFIDCYDPDCVNFAGCAGGYVGNDANCEAKPSSFPKFSMSLDWGSPNQVVDHLTRVSIGDLDRDAIPEVVTLNSVTNRLYILDGRNGSIKKSLNPGYDVQREMVIGNIDNDNCAELFTYAIVPSGKASLNYIVSYDCNFNELWRTQIRGNVGATAGDPVHFGLADFDGDGKVELYCKDMILDAHTGTIIVNSATDWTFVNGGPVAVDILGTGKLQLVIGCGIYNVNLGTRAANSGSITLVKSRPEYQTRSNPIKINYHTTSVADYNLDGFIDVLATGSYNANNNTTAFFWDVHNDVLKTYNDYIAGNITINGCNGSTGAYYARGWESGMGRINIGDLDGDGKMNASYVSGKYLYALDDQFKLLWRKDVKEETSGYTGCTLFDFNGDGKAEVVYRDENYLYIINGVDGATFTQQTCISRTNREYPIVADVDNDGATELCVTCGFDDVLSQQNFCNNNYYQNGQVRVFRSAAQPWVPARKLWNQHGYFNVNVNDDLTIPKIQQNPDAIFSTASCTPGPNRPLNTFLNQAPYINSKGCPIYAAPDLSYVPNSLKINPPTCPDQNFTVSFQITNLGDVAVTGVIPITFYSGDPNLAGAVKLNTINITLTNFKKGDVFSATNLSVTGPGTSFTLYGIVNDAGTSTPTPIKLPNTNVLECNYNNAFSASVTPLPFQLTAITLADNTKCVGGTTPNNGAVEAYQLVNGSKITAPYTFYWYNSGLPVSGAPNFTGAVYSGLPAGSYSVYAKSSAFQCSSDTASVSVNLVNNTPPNVQIDLVNPYTNCKNPNGRLRATINSHVADSVNYDFIWYEGNDIFTSPQIGLSATALNLKNTTYTVLVTSKITGCQSVNSFPIPDNSNPVLVNANATDAICSTSNSGSATADVGGNTTNFTFNWYNGSSVKPVPDFVGATYSNLAQGQYTVVATDKVFLCSSSPPTTVTVTQTAAIVVSAVKISDQTSCDQIHPNGSASASVGGTTSGYSFAWFSGQNTLPANLVASTSTATGLQQGVYTVQATDDATGCKDTDEVTIDNGIVTPSLTGTGVDVTHCTPYDGSVTATVSTGVPTDYTFSWYNGAAVKSSPDYPDTDNVLDKLLPGKYTVAAINTTLKCVAAAITITILDKTPSINMSLVNTLTIYPSDCTQPTGTLGVAVSAPGNTLGYDVQWFSGRSPFTGSSLSNQTVPSVPGRTVLANIATGVYSVVGTDKNSGCSATQSFDLPFANSHKLTYVSQVDVSTCVPGNDGKVTVKLTPSLPATTFNESDYRIDVFQGSNPTGTAIETINGVAAVTNYTTSVAMSAGFYSFVAICTGPAGNNLVGCKSVPITAEIKQSTTNPSITSTSSNSNTNCTGIAANGSITVSIDGGASPLNYTTKWFEGSNTSAPALGTTTGTTGGVNGEAAQSLKGGTYTVQVTSNTTGCFSTSTYSIFDNPPTISMSSADLTTTPQTLCNTANGSATVNSIRENGVVVGLANYTFQWFDASMNLLPGTTNTESPLTTGTYYVQITNTVNNCPSASPFQFAITDQTIGTVSVSLTSFVQPTRCLQPANTLGSLTAAASGTSTTGYNYNWYLGTSASGVVQATSQTINGITVVAPATEAVYTVEAINNSNQCKVVDTYHLPLIITPVTISASAAALTNCAPLNGSVFATVTSGSSNNYVYTWYTGSVVGGTPTYIGKQVNGLDKGTYTIVAVDNADATCTATATATVGDSRVFTAPIAVQLSPLTNCDITRPNGVASASVNSGGVKDSINYVFQWYVGTNITVPPIYTGSEITGLTNTQYTVVATNRITSCPSQATVTITNGQATVPLPSIEVLSNVTSCAANNGALSASVNGDTKDYIFSWYIGAAVKPVADFMGEIYSGRASGLYTVIAQSRITGCVSGPTTGEIKTDMVYPKIMVKTSPSACDLKSPDGIHQGNGSAEVVVTNDVSIESITWSVGSPPVTGPLLDTLSAGTYQVVVKTTSGCKDSIQFTIQDDIRPYNGISRNRDGVNETFHIGCIEMFPNNLVKIFNRAGTLVYEDKGYDNAMVVFDGHSNRGVSPLGTLLPDGTYFYVIDRGDGAKPLAGYLEIIK